MAWAKLDDAFAEHPKVVGLPDAAFRLHVHALCYASRNLTDGAIPVGALRLLRGTQRQVAVLVSVGLWERAGPGWAIHDYLHYNPSRTNVETRRQELTEMRRRAGQASGNKRRNTTRTNAEQTANKTRTKGEPRSKRTKREPRSRSPTRSPTPSPLTDSLPGSLGDQSVSPRARRE